MKFIKDVFLYLVIVFLWMPVAQAQPEKESADVLFSKAVNAYHQAHYDDAIVLNERSLTQGFFSSALYYNLGNAYFKSGRTGKAVLNYLRALRISPRDSDIKANLFFARSMVENFLPMKSDSIFSFIKKLLSKDELRWLAFILFMLTGIFMLGALYAGVQYKRVVQGVILLGCLTVFCSATALEQAISNHGIAVCINNAEARFEPNAQATVYFKVPEGTEMKIIREKEGWVKIERSDGKNGWISSILLEKV
ncbi:MAG: SH3 domain-containing protein [Candidatus Omnitrophota bacterium]